jgi:hypothetical protein
VWEFLFSATLRALSPARLQPLPYPAKWWRNVFVDCNDSFNLGRKPTDLCIISTF